MIEWPTDEHLAQQAVREEQSRIARRNAKAHLLRDLRRRWMGSASPETLLQIELVKRSGFFPRRRVL